MSPVSNFDEGDEIAIVEERTEIDLDIFEEGDKLTLTNVDEYENSRDERVLMYTLEGPDGGEFTITNTELVKAPEFRIL